MDGFVPHPIPLPLLSLFSFTGLIPYCFKRKRMDGSLNWRDLFFSLLLSGILLVCSGIVVSQAQVTPREVNGIVGGSVLLSIMMPNVVEVRLKFGSRKIRLGDSKGRRFEPYNLSDNSLPRRIQMENESTLNITSLMKNDSGIFRAEVQLHDGATVDVEFHLKVYDPVPVPHIVNETIEKTSDWCNFTLNCQIPSESNVNFSWAIPMSDVNKSRKYEKISDGRKLQRSLRTDVPTHIDSEYFCLVSNPADQQNTSISGLCPKGSLSSRRTGYFFIPLGLILLPILGLFIYVMVKKRKKRKSEASTSVELLETRSPSIHYTEIKNDGRGRDGQVHGNQEQRPAAKQPNQKRIQTIYDEIRTHQVGHIELYAQADHDEAQMFTTYACVARSHPDGNEVQCDSEYSSPKMDAKQPELITIYDVLQPPPNSTLAEIC